MWIKKLKETAKNVFNGDIIHMRTYCSPSKMSGNHTLNSSYKRFYYYSTWREQRLACVMGISIIIRFAVVFLYWFNLNFFFSATKSMNYAFNMKNMRNSATVAIRLKFISQSARRMQILCEWFCSLTIKCIGRSRSGWMSLLWLWILRICIGFTGLYR